MEKSLYLFVPGEVERPTDMVKIEDLEDPLLEEKVGPSLAKRLREEVALLTGVYPAFDMAEYLSGKAHPRLLRLGPQQLRRAGAPRYPGRHGPPSHAKAAAERVVRPRGGEVHGLHLQDPRQHEPKHRDRVAFLRVCSGKFERNASYYHVRSGKPFRTANPTAFMAQDSEIVNEAWPGDIVGIHDTGTFKIGDTITQGESIHFDGIPSFAPQIFRFIVNADPSGTSSTTRASTRWPRRGSCRSSPSPTGPT